jgi:hypothetical protein
LNEQEMTGLIGAVDMRIRGLPALMAPGDDISGDTFTETLVKNKILSNEPGGQAFFLDLAGIVYDPPFKVKHVPESIV